MATIRKRGNAWQVQIRFAHSKPLTKTFKDKKSAQTWAIYKKAEILSKKDALSQNEDNLMSFSTLLERYRDSVVTFKKSRRVEEGIINHALKEDFTQLKVSDVNQMRVSEYRDYRLSSIKVASFVREVGIFRHCWEVAQKEWGLKLGKNPFKNLRLPKLNGRRERRLQAGEMDQLLHHAKVCRNPYIIPIIVFAVETAMRGSEIINCEWSDFDATRNTLHIRMSKNHHSRIIPLTPRATRVLLRLPPTNDIRIFPITLSSFKQSWHDLLKRTGIHDLHFHDLRHEAISRFVEGGLTLPEVASISGHRDSRSLLRYAHPSQDLLVKKLRMLEGLMPITGDELQSSKKKPHCPILVEISALRERALNTKKNWIPDDFGTEEDFIRHATHILRKQHRIIPLEGAQFYLQMARHVGLDIFSTVKAYKVFIENNNLGETKNFFRRKM